MRISFSKLRLWLALIAFACHALSPVLSHAMLAKSGQSLVEICTPDGFKTVEIGEAGKTTPSLNHYPHGGDCLSAYDAPAQVAHTSAVLSAPVAAGGIKLSAGVTAFASAIRLHAQPRAPPLS